MEEGGNRAGARDGRPCVPQCRMTASTALASASSGRRGIFNQSPGLLPGYLIEFVEQWKERGPDERLLDSRDSEAAWEFKRFVVGVDWRGALGSSRSNRRAFQQATVLHLVHPDTFEAILNDNHKSRIARRFAQFVTEPTEDVDRKLEQIRRGLEAELGRDFDFYNDDDIFNYWSPSASVPERGARSRKRRVWRGRLSVEQTGSGCPRSRVASHRRLPAEHRAIA